MLTHPVAALVCLAVVFALLLMPLPVGRGQLWSTLENSCHPVMFALVAIGLLLFVRSRIRDQDIRSTTVYVASGVVSIALGAITELAQLITNRDASWIDFGNDALGTVAGLSFFALFETRRIRGRRRWMLRLAGLAATALAIAPLAWALAAYTNRALALPVLWRHSNFLDLYFLNPICSERSLEPRIDRRDAPPRAARFALGTCAYAGFELSEPYPDWRAYRELRIELSNPTERALEVTLRIQDRTHNWRYEDRFNLTFVLAAGAHVVQHVGVDQIRRGPQARLLDLARMGELMVFANTPRGSEMLVLHEIALER